MRTILVILFMMIASNIYAQKVLTFDDNLEDALIEYLVHTDCITSEFMKTLKHIRNEITDQDNEYCEPIAVIDIQANKGVHLDDITQDFGMFCFHCPMIDGSYYHVFIKHYNSVIIIEEDFTPTDDGHRDWIYITLMKNTEFLNNFFKDHLDIPKRYYPIYLNNLIRVLELNSSRDYQLYN